MGQNEEMKTGGIKSGGWGWEWKAQDKRNGSNWSDLKIRQHKLLEDRIGEGKIQESKYEVALRVSQQQTSGNSCS